ncbi:sensor domain-containing diguanylate cyclase [Vibrio sp.]|uniref:sensor domain-containing diguanylate cyclase n=1 Tax=Vibrio sp. TaxID=678 RepID=UPI003D0A259A
MEKHESELQKLIAENQRLSERVTSLEETLDQIGSYLYIKDSDGNYTYANKMVRELFDRPMERIAGYDDSEFFDLDKSDDIKINDRRVLIQGETVKNEEKNIVTATGETHYYMTVKQPLKNGNGHITGMFGVSTDITERKAMELELRQKTELLDTILNNIDAFIYMKDRQYRFVYVNPKTAELFGLDQKDIIGKTDEEILSIESAEQFRAMDEKVFLSGEKQVGEESLIGSDGLAHYYWSIKAPMTDPAGEVDRLIGFSTDITELSLLRNQLSDQVKTEIIKRIEQERLAVIDSLTQVYNRGKLDEILAYELNRAERLDSGFGVILIDVDHFKRINDTFGHQTGDLVLMEIADILQNSVRKIDTVGRWGGEEFLIICPDTHQQGLVQLAERIRVAIAQHDFPIAGNQTTSFGVANYQYGDTPLNVIARADSALYKAKRHGKNRVEVSV